MFDGYRRGWFDSAGVDIAFRTAGDGPPLLLVHGYPQTHLTWHQQAAALAERFTVVAPDLRGYGDSGKPAAGADHAAYAKRTMAADLAGLMAHLGHDRFMVAGHDRGGRVAYRLALDRPDAVERLAVLDIVPTKAVYDGTDRTLATGYYHWFFLIQPAPLPETLIAAAPGLWLDRFFAQARAAGAVTPDAHAAYAAAFTAETIRASCDDYRAGAGPDYAHDAADRAAGRRIACPTLVLWGAKGMVARGDPLATWRDYAADVRGHALDCGHFLPEERPDEVTAALLDFFGG